MSESTSLQLKDNTANPAALGLLAFGMTTVLLNLHNAGIFEMNSMILAMGIFYGGSAQVIAGIMEWKKNNTFGLTAFVSYGFFWLSLVALIVMPKLGWIAPSSGTGMIWYLIMWGIFTFLMFFGTLKLSRALQVVFATLTVLFFLLAISDATGNAGLETFTGYEGIFCGASAIYAGIAQVLNEVYGKVVFPLGIVKK
jgi:succinate-acetate transporter protein